MQLVLASSSPRRKQLLRMLGLPFDILVSDVDESFDDDLSPSEIVQQLAYKKAYAVWQQASDACVIGADTIVVCEGDVLGKPASEQDAFRMLKRLSGTTHEVWTGVAICTKKNASHLLRRRMSHFGRSQMKTFGRILRRKSRLIKRGHMAFNNAGHFSFKK